MEWISILTGYLLGSIPSAVWIGKKIHNTDVREFGSKNAGATNTFRILGWKTGVLVLLVDMAKGYGAILLSMKLFDLPAHDLSIILCALAAVLGHVFPVFAGFRGGKGIATAAGVSIALIPISFLFLIGLFLLVFAISKYISLSSLAAAISLPFISYYVEGNHEIQLVIFTIIIAVIVPVTHHRNIVKLLNGTERKIRY
ncbi:MAG: glycerol-3-phosphate 1-O-acyltransferase PlsY [Bacteroidales bacterium]